jgi:hypothetical protein
MSVSRGWKSLYDGTIYAGNDERIAGYGNPPGCPNFQKENPGQGSLPMSPIAITIDGKGNISEVK